MEGNTSKIQTMAGDLERARVGSTAPQPPSVKVLPQAMPTGSPRFGEAGGQALPSERIQPPAPPVRPVEKAEVKEVKKEERKLSEILAEAKKRLEGELPQKTLGDIRPSPKPLVSPPPNLPIVEPLRGLVVPVLPKGDQKKSTRETPEEILGLLGIRAAPTGRQARPSGPSVIAPSVPREKEHKKIATFKFAFITGVLSIVFVAIAGGAYLKFFVEKPSPPPPPAPPPLVEEPMPKALVRYEDVKILEATELAYGSMKAKIDSLEYSQFPVSSSGPILYIPIRLKTEKQIRYLTLDELFQALKIDAPAQIRDTKEYNLFLYAQRDTAKAECLAAGITDNLCYGPRIGLIIKMPQAEPGGSGFDVRQLMQEWEKTMADDLRPLLLALPQKGGEVVFKTGKYRDFETRYISLPISTTSFDWILADNTLIIATSKDAARAALDRILENEAAK